MEYGASAHLHAILDGSRLKCEYSFVDRKRRIAAVTAPAAVITLCPSHLAKTSEFHFFFFLSVNVYWCVDGVLPHPLGVGGGARVCLQDTLQELDAPHLGFQRRSCLRSRFLACGCLSDHLFGHLNTEIQSLTTRLFPSVAFLPTHMHLAGWTDPCTLRFRYSQGILQSMNL